MADCAVTTYKSSVSLKIVIIGFRHQVYEERLCLFQKLLHFFVGALIDVLPRHLLRPPSLWVPAKHDPPIVRVHQVSL